MSKIAIISQPDQGVLIDVGGCSSYQEAVSHLSSTLQVSNQFWKGNSVALNFGYLELTPPQVAQLVAIAEGVGATPKHVFSENEPTRASLRALKVPIGKGKPMTLPKVKVDTLSQHELEEEVEPAVKKAVAVSHQNSVTVYETDETEYAVAKIDEDKMAAEEIEDDIVADSDSDKTDIGDDIEDGVVDEEVESESDEDEMETADVEVVDEEEDEEIKSRTSPPKSSVPQVPAVLYLRQNLRSGQTVSHKGHLVIIGDVNPGAEVMAEGDVTVWGTLRGIAHAGIGGNTESEVRALKLQPVQIRIAHAIARSPDKPRVKFSKFNNAGPETARIVDGKIKIVKSSIE